MTLNGSKSKIAVSSLNLQVRVLSAYLTTGGPFEVSSTSFEKLDLC